MIKFVPIEPQRGPSKPFEHRQYGIPLLIWQLPPFWQDNSWFWHELLPPENIDFIKIKFKYKFRISRQKQFIIFIKSDSYTVLNFRPYYLHNHHFHHKALFQEYIAYNFGMIWEHNQMGILWKVMNRYWSILHYFLC